MRPKQRLDGSSPEKSISTPRKYTKMEKPKFHFEPPPEAPVFSPTLEEFENPLKYINKIRQIGQKTGICKIIPPPGWKVPFVLDHDKLKFTPRIQRINELEARTRIKLNFIDQLTKFFALKGKAFQVPLLEKRALDLYTLHKLVKEYGGLENVNKNKSWNDIAIKMGFLSNKTPALLRTHYDHLILPFITARLEAERKNEAGEFDKLGDDTVPTLRELKSLTFLGPGPKMAVCDFKGLSKSVKSRTRGKKILYEFDPLAKYMCKSCANGEIEETLVTCMVCDDRYHFSCLIPPVTEANVIGWKCPKCVATEHCKSLDEFGFAQAEREYTLNEFREMADHFKSNYFKTTNPKEIPTGTVEQEFWRVVSSIEESVTVEYGADLHVIDHGSAFPVKNKPPERKIDTELFNKYADSAWNLNNLPVLKASVLRHISADISGMKIPWMYAGMCFATFCWHNEDHWSYSINYLHMGEPKTWYGVPGSSAEDFEKAMKEEAPELFDSQPDILHQLVTIMNPNDIMKAGVPIYRTDQKEGEFVITFPRAYHAGFNQGFNFAEACNFAPYDWLHIGRECISHYSSLKRYCVFSHDELVCKMAEIYEELDKKILHATYKDMKNMLNAEHTKRRFLLMQGIRNASRVKFDELPDDERQCFVCKTTCFLSALVCKCNPSRLVCLDHYEQLCTCPPSNFKLKFHYKIDELVAILYMMRSRVEYFDKWIVRVNKGSTDQNRKIYFRIFTDLLIDSKDKEVTKDELLNLLEEQVRDCLKMSTRAKSFMKKIVNEDSDSLKKGEKTSVDDLIEFSKELQSYPCTLAETNSIKKSVEISIRLKKIVQKLLSCKAPKKKRIEHAIELIKSTNLEFEELPHLEGRLKECKWFDECSEVLSRACFSEDILKLVDHAGPLPKSLGVKRKLKELYEKALSLQSWGTKVQNIFVEPFKTLEEVESTFQEGIKYSYLKPDDKERLTTLLTEAHEITSKIDGLLSGNVTMYLSDIDDMIEKAKSLPISFKSLAELESCLLETRRWKSLAQKYYQKRSSPVDLMNVLWPRKYAKRSLFYSRPSGMTYRSIESIIDDKASDFTKEDFYKALKEQTTSLHELRLNNIAARNRSPRMCPCNTSLGGKPSLECELCCTVYHSQCFVIDDSANNPILYNSYNKLLCSFCIRTRRPNYEKVKELLAEARKLKVKIPECYAVEWNSKKIGSWIRKAQKVMLLKDLVSGLEVISANSKKVSKLLAVKKDASPTATQTITFEEIQDFQKILLSPERIFDLKFLLQEIDSLEVTTREGTNIWLLLMAVNLNNLMSTVVTVPPAISSNLPKNKVQVVKKANPTLKPTPQPSTMTTRKRRSTSDAGKALAEACKVIRTESGPSSPGASSVVTEEDEECASDRCLRPKADSLDWIQCDGRCAAWFHMVCVDVTKSEISEDDDFICYSCIKARYADGHSSPESPCRTNSSDDPLYLPLYFLRQFIGRLEEGEDVSLKSCLAQTLSVTDQLSKLTEGITLLDKELKKQVLEKHEDLVSQATWVEKLQGVLSIMHVHIQSLLSSVERVRGKVVEPFNRIESQTLVLSRLHATSDLLRRAARIQQLVKRLHGLSPLRAAHIIAELGELYQDVDLSGLEILEAEERQIKKETAIVELKASKIVEQGLIAQNQEQVAEGIEIMMKLNIAEREVNKLMEDALKQVKSSMKNALDMSVLVPPTNRGGGAGRAAGFNIPNNVQQFRNKLWNSWENTLMQTVYPMCYQMYLVQNVLNNKLGEIHFATMDSEKQSDLALVFWNEVDDQMRKYLVKAAENSPFIKQALESEYPKLLRLHLDFHKKLQKLHVPGFSQKSSFPPMGNCLKTFEHAYLNKCITVVQKAVRDIFPDSECSGAPRCPTSDNVDSLIKIISNELSVALVDEALTKPVAHNVVTKAIFLFCQKAEEMIISTPEASQVIDIPNASQELNVQIANIVYYFSEQIKHVLNNLNLQKSISSSIINALKTGENMTQEIINPLLASIIVAIDSILVTMHNEDYNLKEYTGSTSLYMRELQTFIARAATTYLAPFHNQVLVTQSCVQVASRTLEMFVRNVVLLRPISEAGQKKILADFKHVEDAVNPLCTQLNELGKTYRTLRSLRAIVASPTSEVASCPVLGQAIPYSLAITLLISRGPPALPSPHQSLDWSVAAYSEWLDNHPDERDRLEMLSGAMQKYRKTIFDKGLSSFDKIYPVIKALLEKAFQHVSTSS